MTAKTDIEDLRRDERIRLNTFAWIDEGAGVARIPIDRAIDLMLEEGFAPPAREVAVPSRPTISFGATDDEPEPEAESEGAPGAELIPAEEDE